MKIRVLAMVIALVMFLTCGAFKILASENTYAEIENRINNIICNGTEYYVEDVSVLRASTGEEKYLLMKLSPYGYAILNLDTNIFEEISHYATDIPYNVDSGVECYYFGPNNYYYLEDDVLINTKNGNALDDAEYASLLDAEASKESREATALSTNNIGNNATVYGSEVHSQTFKISNSSYFTSLLGNDYGDNKSGTCTMVATAILLGFYDNYVNDAYVPIQFRSGYGTTESFHKLMCSYMNPSGGSAGIQVATNKVNQYFADFGVSATAYCVIGDHNDVFDVVRSKISAGRPLVTAMFNSYNSDSPMDHSNVTYGYTARWIIQTGEYLEVYYHVHNGWLNSSENFASYNYAWFADAMYINK